MEKTIIQKAQELFSGGKAKKGLKVLEDAIEEAKKGPSSALIAAARMNAGICYLCGLGCGRDAVKGIKELRKWQEYLQSASEDAPASCESSLSGVEGLSVEFGVWYHTHQRRRLLCCLFDFCFSSGRSENQRRGILRVLSCPEGVLFDHKDLVFFHVSWLFVLLSLSTAGCISRLFAAPFFGGDRMSLLGDAVKSSSVSSLCFESFFFSLLLSPPFFNRPFFFFSCLGFFRKQHRVRGGSHSDGETLRNVSGQEHLIFVFVASLCCCRRCVCLRFSCFLYQTDDNFGGLESTKFCEMLEKNSSITELQMKGRFLLSLFFLSFLVLSQSKGEGGRKKKACRIGAESAKLLSSCLARHSSLASLDLQSLHALLISVVRNGSGTL